MFTYRKSLGQHFLTDENISRKIIASLKQHPVQRLLEVGPGGGALTKFLLEDYQGEFKAIEVDEEKIRFLLNTFPVLHGKLIHKNILDSGPPYDQPFTVIGNFPYNISTQILFKLLEWKELIEGVIGMFQKEVAQRIAAREGNKIYGVTSVLIQAFFRVEYLFEVSENCFTPPPKVKSAVIGLRPLEKPVLMKDEDSFSRLVKTAFNQRRKMLRNAVGNLFDPLYLKEDIFNKRAEQLTVIDFGQLSFKMKDE